MVALTATCTKLVRQDIIGSLGLRDPQVLQFSFNRPNIRYQVTFKDGLATSAEDLDSDRISAGVVKVCRPQSSALLPIGPPMHTVIMVARSGATMSAMCVECAWHDIGATKLRIIDYSPASLHCSYDTCHPGCNTMQDILEHIEVLEGSSGIIYCRTRSDCEQLTKALNDAMSEGQFEQYDWSVGCYHAGLTQFDRHKVQRQWQDGDIVAVVATIAFGMGIDKSDIRWVMHYTLSSSLEGFAQV